MYRPFMAVEDQVQRLNDRGLQTGARTPWILEREGYYSVVNGYKDPFLDKEAEKQSHEDRYLAGTSFNDLYALLSSIGIAVVVPDGHEEPQPRGQRCREAPSDVWNEIFHRRNLEGVNKHGRTHRHLDEHMARYPNERIRTELGMSAMDRRRMLGRVT